jgi:hypothetical protein
MPQGCVDLERLQGKGLQQVVGSKAAMLGWCGCCPGAVAQCICRSSDVNGSSTGMFSPESYYFV